MKKEKFQLREKVNNLFFKKNYQNIRLLNKNMFH